MFFNDVVEPLFSRLYSSRTQPQPEFASSCDGAKLSPTTGTRSVSGSSLDGETVWNWRGFCHAYSLVSARAFVVDAFHGLAMVPVADA